MGSILKCKFCGTEYDSSERYLRHMPDRCELALLRRLADDLSFCLDDDAEEAVTDLKILAQRAKALRA